MSITNEDYDRILNDLRQKRNKILDFSRRVKLYPDTDNLYSWNSISINISENIESSELEVGVCPLCKHNLNKTIYKIEFNNYRDLYICEHCRTQFDVDLNALKNSDVPDRSIDISQINPAFVVLIETLRNLGCHVSNYNKGGDYGYLIIEYNNTIFGITLNEEAIILLFYPKWSCIPCTEISSILLSSIQSHNLNSDNCIYWLQDGNTILLSSVINIDSEKVGEPDYIMAKLNSLLQSKNILDSESTGNIAINHDIVERTNIAEHISVALSECGCNVQEIDEDGDIWFGLQKSNMYARIINNNTVKLIFNCMVLNCTDEYIDCQENEVDQIVLSLQWINMIYPIKATYYKPDVLQHSISASIDIDISHFFNCNIKLLSKYLNELSNVIDYYFNDIIFATERGINIVDTWYQPNIGNLKID